MNLDLTNLSPRPGAGRHLTGEQVSRIERYVADILRRLDLAHWRVYVSTHLPPEDCLLMIEPTDGRRIAMLYVSEDWWKRDADEKRTDLVHEALHLAHHDTDSNVRRFLGESGDLSEYVKHVVISQFKTDLERMVDSLSYAVAPHLPAWDEGE